MSKLIRVEIVSAEKCISHKVGDVFHVGLKTEAGICTKLLHSLYPAATGLMWAEMRSPPRSITVTCPDGLVKARLTQVPDEGEAAPRPAAPGRTES